MALNLTLNTTNVTEAKFVNAAGNEVDLTEIKYKKGSGGSAVTVWKKITEKKATLSVYFRLNSSFSINRDQNNTFGGDIYPFGTNGYHVPSHNFNNNQISTIVDGGNGYLENRKYNVTIFTGGSMAIPGYGSWLPCVLNTNSTIAPRTMQIRVTKVSNGVIKDFDVVGLSGGGGFNPLVGWKGQFRRFDQARPFGFSLSSSGNFPQEFRKNCQVDIDPQPE